MKKSTPTTECLSDFLRRNGKPVTFSGFARVSPSTVRRWETGESEPIGENLLRVRHFLNLCGYEVAELATLNPLIFEIGQIIAAGCATLDEIAKVLKVEDYHQILRYLRGEVEPSPERKAALERLADAKRQSLAQRLAEIDQVLRKENLLIKNQPTSESDVIGKFESACGLVREHGSVLLNGPREQRILMRQKMGTGSEPDLHKTWEILNNLLNEKNQTDR